MPPSSPSAPNPNLPLPSGPASPSPVSPANPPSPNLPNPQSPQGPQGPQNPAPQSPVSPANPPSPNLPNPQSPQSPQGPQGPQGPQNPAPQSPLNPANPPSPNLPNPQSPQGPQGPQNPAPQSPLNPANPPSPNLPNPQSPQSPQGPQNPQSPQSPQNPGPFSTLTALIDQLVPLVEEAMVLAKVVGDILVAANQTNGPPPTYYIGLDPNDPSAPAPTQTMQSGPAITPVVGIGIDQAGGFSVVGPDNGVLLGSGGTPVAVVGLSMVNGSPVLTGNGTILVGPQQLPLAGQGSATGSGPLVDQSPDGVHMQVSPDMMGPPNKHTLYNVAGTGGQWDQDFTAEVASQVNGEHWYWQGVSYPAATFPMGPSVHAGVEELVRLIAERPGSFGIMGYSQGAIVTCKVWRDEILNPNGRLHDRKDDLFAHVTFGNPLRCPGFANGNALANLPPPKGEFGLVTGGIAGPDDLTPWQTRPWHMDFAHDGDLFTTCPTGGDPWSNETEVGAMQTAIYKMVQGDLAGQDSLLLQLGKILSNPFGEMIPLFESIADAIGFLANNTHGYPDCRDPAIQWLRDIGAMTPVKSV